MKPSKHNIIGRLKNSSEYYIVNLLSGQADILEPEKAKELLAGTVSDPAPFVEKGYIVDPAEEDQLFRAKYLNFIENREKDEIQIFFVPWYTCNFSCSYCYQEPYHNEPAPLNKEIIDSFFTYIDNTFANRQKYVTIFGGEPLLHGARAKETIGSILEHAGKRGIDVAVVTNGYYLSEYVPLLKTGSIREVQVTLDGPEAIHNQRRPLKGSSEGTFGRIVQGIDDALAASLKINLRVVLDRENTDSLPELARFAIERGWTDNPLFKTQLGRNYELHHCHSGPQKIYSRIELYEKIYHLIERHPEILRFHEPAFSISRFLSENGYLPEPLFDSCPGCKTEWAFDYTGSIYSCTATVGKEDQRLGTFFRNASLRLDRVEEWQERDILAIEKCRTCSLALACGGGCASVAQNQLGSLHAPDCRPIQELISLGIPCYFKNEATNV